MEGVFSEIQFSVLSEDDILNLSVLEITNPKLTGEGSVQDVRMGLGIPEMKTSCVTCRNSSYACHGHFGHIQFRYPIFHPLFEKEILKVLKVFCFRCFRFIRIEADGTFTDFEKIIKFDKKYMCPHCGARQPIWNYVQKNAFIKGLTENGKEILFTPHDIRTIFVSLNKEDLEKIGVTTWPENLIITILPVIPPCCRPSVYTEEKANDDHLTVQYSEILKANLAIDQSKPPLEQLSDISTLIWRTTVLFNNPGGKGKYNTNGKAIQGFGQRLAGKTGLPREHLMGKRVDQSGRTVIGAEPTLRIDQVAVPKKIANLLTREEIVYSLNIEYLSKLLKEGKISTVSRGGRIFNVDNLQVGDIVNRYLVDGDYVLINRQPTLHKGSMIAFKTVISESSTICFNLSNAKTFNADFDGDEMNIHVPQKYNEVAELEELSSIRNHILSERNGSANIVLVQDNILSLYLMSIEDDLISQAELNDITMYLVDEKGNPWDLSRIMAKMEHVKTMVNPTSGRGIISLCFPDNFSYNVGEVVFKEGIFLSGVYDKGLSSKLIELLYHLYGDIVIIMIINNLQFISNRWLNLRGFTVGFEDCLLKSKKAYENIQESIERCFAHAEAVSSRITHSRIREIRVQEELNNARNIGMKIAKDGFRDGNNFNHTVRSGSKGDFFNIAQIAGVLGQQYLHGRRIDEMLNDDKRTLPHYLYEDTNLKHKYEARGFVRHSFLRGLNPREAYYHAVVGRSGVTSTALSTSESGYMQRRIVKLTEDIHVNNLGTVTDESGLIYQFSYGDGFDTIHNPNVDIVKHLVNKITI